MSAQNPDTDIVPSAAATAALTDIENRATSSPSFCGLPWRHLFVSPDGNVKPCCRYIRGKNFPEVSNPAQAFHSTYWENLRRDMLHNKTIAGCAKCDQEERLNTKSLREKINTDAVYAINPLEDKPEAHTLEVAFSNTCNLSCIMCDSRFSSAWTMVEKQLFGKTLYPEKKFRFNAQDLNAFPGLRLLKVTGGEPFLEHQIHLATLNYIVEFLKPEGFRLDYSTNLTVLPKPQIIEQWAKFERVEVTLSLDSIFENELKYIRYPSDAATIRTHVRFYLELMNQLPNLHVVVRPTVHVLNIASMLYTMQWWYSEKQKYAIDDRCKDSVSFLAYPEFLQPTALSPDEQLRVRHLVENFTITKSDHKNLLHHQTRLLNYLHEKPFDPRHAQKLKEFLKAMDSHRGTHFRAQFEYLNDAR